MVDLSSEANNLPKDATDRERLHALIDALSSYIEFYHGGSVKLVAYEGDIAKIELGGACLGCPLSPHTLQGWVSGTIRQFFPSLKIVAVEPEAAE
ncbi:MAG: NifU family protein [Anaerolineae bacterium]|nr:NifU family protein [Anaerolineae bacterium]